MVNVGIDCAVGNCGGRFSIVVAVEERSRCGWLKHFLVNSSGARPDWVRDRFESEDHER